MAPELAFKIVSYGLIELLWVTALALSLVSLRKESHCGERLKGFMVLTAAIIGFCAFIALVMAYTQKTKLLEKSSHPVQTVRLKLG